jgi:glutamyl-tRNA synthetase
MLKTRLAPTPSGFLHLGNLLVFVCSWRLARANQGSLLLRIDDLDAARKRTAYVEDIFESLHWLGIDWDEGPRNLTDFEQNWSQFHRLGLANQLLEELRKKNLLYSCNCSRTQLESLAKFNQPHYCREKKDFQTVQGYAWRIRLPENCQITLHDHQQGQCNIDLNAHMPDFVVRRKDGLPAYQIASLSDDLQFGINSIVRGLDLLPSSAAQLFLAEQLGISTFSTTHWWHLPLVTDAFGNKLSKSNHARPVADLRKAGKNPEVLWTKIDALLASA